MVKTNRVVKLLLFLRYHAHPRRDEAGIILTAINNADLIVFAYPVQFSTVPKIVRDFVTDNKELWKNKKVFVIATMGLFSGDGSEMLGRLLESCGAEFIGGLHLKMPDSIADEKSLKRPLEKIIES